MFYISYLFSILPAPYKIGINIWAFEFMKIIASAPLNIIMNLLASSFFVVLPLIALYLYFIKKDKNVYTFAVAVVLFYIISDLIKNLVREPRPCHFNITGLNWINNLSCENSFSFPSNHASVLTGLGFFLKNYKYVEILYIAWLILVLFGRVYLGVHYLTDVIAGIFLSIFLYYLLNHFRTKINSVLNNIVKKISPKLALK